jgi:hypothetical protein
MVLIILLAVAMLPAVFFLYQLYYPWEGGWNNCRYEKYYSATSPRFIGRFNGWRKKMASARSKLREPMSSNVCAMEHGAGVAGEQ